MSTKMLVSIGILLGSVIGGYIPFLFGDKSLLSFTAVLTSGIGAIIGVFAGIEIGKRLGN